MASSIFFFFSVHREEKTNVRTTWWYLVAAGASRTVDKAALLLLSALCKRPNMQLYRNSYLICHKHSPKAALPEANVAVPTKCLSGKTILPVRERIENVRNE
jgi:hypothetical protein